jgi:polysaccharide biosynthesis protein PslH
MKILYVTPYSPWPPDRGSPMRAYGVLNLLARRHDVTVALMSASADECSLFKNGGGRKVHCAVLRPGKAPLYRCLTSSLLERYRPIPAFFSCARGEYATDFQNLVSRCRPDLIWFFRFNPVWQAACRRFSVPVVADMDDFESKSYLRTAHALSGPSSLFARADYFRFVSAQRKAAQACDVVLVANPQDIDEAAAMTGKLVRALPNAFDYSTIPSFESIPERRAVFIGHLGYAPNVDGLNWFVREIWPVIRAAVPDAQLDIGGRPGPHTAAWGQQPGVRICGFVEDVRKFSRNASVAVVPIRRGGGTRIKILEAWAMGLPVVTTTVGCEGLGDVDDQTVCIADAPSQFAARCADLMLNPEKGRTIARAAFQYGRTHFDWSTVEPELEAAINAAFTSFRIM